MLLHHTRNLLLFILVCGYYNLSTTVLMDILGRFLFLTTITKAAINIFLKLLKFIFKFSFFSQSCSKSKKISLQ